MSLTLRLCVPALIAAAAPFSLLAWDNPHSSSNITRIQQNDSSIVYTGTWYPNNETPNSGGSATTTNQLGAQAVVTFVGAGVTWIGVKDVYNGLANVYLDGVLHVVVDTYANTTLYQQPLFTVRGLDRGTHKLSIEVPHLSDPNGLQKWVYIDAFDIERGYGVTGITFAGKGTSEQTDPAITYTGSWYTINSSEFSGGGAVEADFAGDNATITFEGTTITWIGYRDDTTGIARVYIDGQLKATIDTYSPATLYRTPIYSVSGLRSDVPHTLMIESTGTHNPNGSEAWIWLDSFQITGK